MKYPTLFLILLVSVSQALATQFKSAVVEVRTVIDSNQLLPPRLLVTGLSGGIVHPGILDGQSISGDVGTVAPLYLEAWDAYRIQPVAATWKLLEHQVAIIQGNSRVPLAQQDFDVHFNSQLMQVNGANSVTSERLIVSLTSNTPQSLNVGDKLTAHLAVSAEVDF